MKHKRETLRWFGVFALVATLALVAACSPGGTQAPLPTLVATTPGVFGIFVGGTADGPALLSSPADPTTFFDELDEIRLFLNGAAPRPGFVPNDLDGVLWSLNCRDGLVEAALVDPALTDAWDGGNLGSFDGVFDDYVRYGPGTARAYSDRTLVLSCASTSAPVGAEVTRHLVVPGAATESRFAIEAFAITNAGAGPLDLTPFVSILDDGADDFDTEAWQDHGSIGAFEWATKDGFDLADPAIGVVPLLPIAFDVDVASTRGDTYTLRGTGSLATGATTGFAMLAAVRGGFQPGDASGKDAAMIALGDELAALDGGAFCATPANPVFVFTELVEHGAAIENAICDGYAALP